MTLPHSHLSYAAEFAALDEALLIPNGARLPFRTFAEASTYRHRLHKARSVDQKRNTEVYQPGDEMFGRSIYDELICRIRTRGDIFYIYIQKNKLLTNIEPIPEDDEDEPIALPAPEQKLLGASERIRLMAPTFRRR